MTTSQIDLFEMFFPTKFIIETFLVHVNKNNKLVKVECSELLCVAWSMVHDVNHRRTEPTAFWSMDVINIFKCSV